MFVSHICWVVCLCCASLLCLSGDRRAEATPAELFIFNELCALKDEQGPCKAIKDRYFFNVDTGHCELFEYGGCGGNANNFETLEACEETCVVSDDKNPCHLAEAPGPCRGLITRYFFDSESRQCKHFFYGGCFGNANNFRSMLQCQARCQNTETQTKSPDVVVHSGGARRSNVLQPNVVTEELTVSDTLLQTNDTSQDHPKDTKLAELCSSPVDSGTCDGAHRRFAYNPRTKRCQMFLYGGCGGNKNNFTHRRHCIRKCVKGNKERGMKMIRIRKKNMDSILFRSV